MKVTYADPNTDEVKISAAQCEVGKLYHCGEPGEHIYLSHLRLCTPGGMIDLLCGDSVVPKEDDGKHYLLVPEGVQFMIGN